MKDILGRTQYAKALTIMLRDPQTVWWYPPDFMRGGLGDLFVGYEASARLSEMAKNWPAMIETRQHPETPKYKQRRFRWENLANILQSVPRDLHDVIYDELRVAGITIEKAQSFGQQQALLP